MSSRRGQSDGSFRRAWHPKPGAARRVSTKRPSLLGPFQLADGRPLARPPLSCIPAQLSDTRTGSFHFFASARVRGRNSTHPSLRSGCLASLGWLIVSILCQTRTNERRHPLWRPRPRSGFPAVNPGPEEISFRTEGKIEN
jgi:hypothetical protein